MVRFLRVARLGAISTTAAALVLFAPMAKAADPSCQQLFAIKSVSGSAATTITFVNEAKTQRGLLWLGFDGQPKDFGNLAPGETKRMNTFVSHPWMIATGPGDCLQIVMPQAGGSRVRITETGVVMPKSQAQGRRSPTAPPAKAAKGPPAWCSNASNPAERAICDDARLGRLDDAVNVAYRRAVIDGGAASRAAIDEEHARWRSRRDLCDDDASCIARRYAEQIRFLEGFFTN